MCGIVGYIGKEQAAPILLGGCIPNWNTADTIQQVLQSVMMKKVPLIL